MVWWIWILLGLALLALEAATPGGFFALFFGLSAVLVGALSALRLAGPPWLQWVLFSVIAVVALVALRKPLRARFNVDGTRRSVDKLTAETAVALADLPPGEVGKAELRGSTWSARNAGTETIPKGRRCRVERVEGLTLWVRPE
jgi:membrane protein implicated in regulation of membrane protease activity